MKVIKVKQVIYSVVGTSPKKPKQLLLPFPKKKPQHVQMTFHFPTQPSASEKVGKNLSTIA